MDCKQNAACVSVFYVNFSILMLLKQSMPFRCVTFCMGLLTQCHPSTLASNIICRAARVAYLSHPLQIPLLRICSSVWPNAACVIMTSQHTQESDLSGLPLCIASASIATQPSLCALSLRCGVPHTPCCVLLADAAVCMYYPSQEHKDWLAVCYEPLESYKDASLP